MRRRFTREARAAAGLTHDNIVRLLDFGSDRGEFFLVTEFMEAGSLASWRHAGPDGETLSVVFGQVLEALSYAHARGVIHRDLKPENILLSFDGAGHARAKVADFGLAFFRDEGEATERHDFVGTPAYMCPEQAMHTADLSPASDLYSVGVMLYEFIAGARPFKGDSAATTVLAHVNEPIPHCEVRPGYRVGGPLPAMLQRLLAKDPADRPSA